MFGIDRPSDSQWAAPDASPDTAADTPQSPSAASPDRGTVLTDARIRQEYALAYRAKVDAIYGAAESTADSEKSVKSEKLANSDKPAQPVGSIHEVTDVPDRYPDEYVPFVGPQRQVEQSEALTEWLSNVNPDKAGSGRWNNCGECARAVAGTWFGDTRTSAALADDEAGGEPTHRMGEWAGQDPVPASMSEIGRRLGDLGPGSLAIVGFDRRSGGGHWFNAVNHNGRVIAVDGQSGKVGAWPPMSLGSAFDEGNMRYSDAIFFTPNGKVVRDDNKG